MIRFLSTSTAEWPRKGATDIRRRHIEVASGPGGRCANARRSSSEGQTSFRLQAEALPRSRSHSASLCQ